MRYHDPVPLTRAEAERALASGDAEAMADTLVALAFHEPDWRWTQEHCLAFTHHGDARLRAVGATCLGHLARVHGALDLDRVGPRLLDLSRDARTAGQAGDAMDDIRMFMGVGIKRKS